MSQRKIVTVELPDPVWKVYERTKDLVNLKLRGMNKPQLNDSGLVSLLLTRTLLDQAESILNEYEEVGLNQLSIRLADVVGTDGIAPAGLPTAAKSTDSRGRTRRDRSPGFYFKGAGPVSSPDAVKT